jgi:hypothetical protein
MFGSDILKIEIKNEYFKSLGRYQLLFYMLGGTGWKILFKSNPHWTLIDMSGNYQVEGQALKFKFKIVNNV